MNEKEFCMAMGELLDDGTGRPRGEAFNKVVEILTTIKNKQEISSIAILPYLEYVNLITCVSCGKITTSCEVVGRITANGKEASTKGVPEYAVKWVGKPMCKACRNKEGAKVQRYTGKERSVWLTFTTEKISDEMFTTSLMRD